MAFARFKILFVLSIVLLCLVSCATHPSDETASPQEPARTSGASLLDGFSKPPAPIIVPDGRELSLEPPAGPVITLNSLSNGLPTTGLWRQNIALDDINMDGHIDIIAPPTRGATGIKRPVIFLGDSQGNWKEFPISIPSLRYDYGGVDVGDIDGNGLKDIAITGHFSPTYALLQKSPGEFESFSDGLPGEDMFSSRTIKLTDFDLDGHLDIALLADTTLDKENKKIEGEFFRIYYYSDKGWIAEPNINLGRFVGDRMTLADFDQDGNTDIAHSSHAYRDKSLMIYHSDGQWTSGVLFPLTSNAYSFDITGASLDNDRRPDLVVSQLKVMPLRSEKTARKLYHRSVLFACYNQPEAWDCREVSYYSTHEYFMAITSSDLDGNGLDDIVAFQKTGELHIYMNNGDGFQTARVENYSLEGRPYWVDTADINKDGKPEILAAFGGEYGVHGIYCWEITIH